MNQRSEWYEEDYDCSPATLDLENTRDFLRAQVNGQRSGKTAINIQAFTQVASNMNPSLKVLGKELNKLGKALRPQRI